jgi:hypothetical protein
MPLYPMLVRLLGGMLAGNYLLATLIISTLCTIVAVILLYELGRDLYTDEVGRRTVILFLVFPTTFFLLAGYTEALFLVLVLRFWLFARKKTGSWQEFVPVWQPLPVFRVLFLALFYCG